MKPMPILLLSDSVDQHSGLARITRDLCTILSRNPRFRVGSLGLWGNPARSLPWMQYVIDQRGGMWGQGDLPRVWRDFAGSQFGIVLTVWDPTRTLWMTRPEYCGDPELAGWLREGHFAKWGYITLDATGPGDRLSAQAADSLLGYNRLLGYTKWGAEVIRRTIGDVESDRRALDWLPHGLDLDLWKLLDRDVMKAELYPFLHEGDRLIGVVGTNQARKDWGLVGSVCRQLSERDSRLRFWWHTDLLERHWSIPAILHDFGLQDRMQVTTSLTSQELCRRYNACDLTLHPGLGEGFGYPIFESLACGTPPIHGNYAGGADVLNQCMDGKFLIRPETFRLDGLHNQCRPVYDPRNWAGMAESVLGIDWEREKLRDSIAHLGWRNLTAPWVRWFEGGL
jgi:glycosyltransferase involved in cell wall biosynthesis